LRLRRRLPEKPRRRRNLRRLKSLARREKNWLAPPTNPKTTLKKRRQSGLLRSKNLNSSSLQ